MSLTEISRWLLDFFERFDHEVKLLLEKEPFWRVCYQCSDGYCCSKPVLPIMDPEWSLIKSFIKENFSPQNKHRLMQNIESARLRCIFLFDNQCSVYRVRPWICRIFPHTISFFSSPITFQVGGIALPSCPNLAPAFGLKVDQTFFQYPTVVARSSINKLVKCKLKKHRPLWLIDGTEYWREYEGKMPKNKDGTLDGLDMHAWVGLAKLARDKGHFDENKFLAYFGLD